jgi:FlaA1/EpsC-like NDP-sugar epimerase
MNNFLNEISQSVVALPREAKRIIVLVVDISFCVLSVWLAYYLRLGEFIPLAGRPMLAAAVSISLAIPLFIISGLYRAIFRYSGLPAIVSLVRAIGVYGLIYAAIFTAIGFDGIPRTVGLIQPMLLLLFVGTSRAFAKLWLGGEYQSRWKRAALPQLLIYGAGSAGRQLANAMAVSTDISLVGYLDDDDRLHGHVLNGLPIFDPRDLPMLVTQSKVTNILMAMPTISRQRRNAILEALAPLHLSVRTLPEINDLATGKVSLSDIRELDIDDLLGREPVKPNALLINRNTQNKTVLVTGAGGSIGSELCRQILQAKPKRLLLVDMSEFALYQIHLELLAFVNQSQNSPSDSLDGELVAQPIGVSEYLTIASEIVPLLASVCDEVRMQEIMDTWRPHTVYHAAAYKHVPLVEHNPAEGVHNNVWGTRVCAEAAVRNGVRNFVLISTDKAVRPTNIMGASKRLAEMVLQALAELNPAVMAQGGSAPTSRTCFSMVRFGNVLGSSGSVVPLFREQIRNGGPITLTHADITRFFMTIPEAAQLVIQAGAMATGGDVFVLDMGQPVRIVDLARRMVELSGLSVRDENNPEGDIEITVTGLRPGEKLYEELLIGENPVPTQHPRIMKAQEPFLPWSQLQQSLGALHIAKGVNDVALIRGLLQQLVSGYHPTGEVVDWVYLAQDREAVAVGGE